MNSHRANAAPLGCGQNSLDMTRRVGNFEQHSLVAAMLRKCLALTCALSGASALTMRPMVRSGLSVGRPALRMMCAEAAPAEPAPAAKKEPAAEVEEVPPFALLDVRVGKIVKAWAHPESEKLWCEQIDVGEKDEEGNVVPREIASGLRAYYPTADLLEGRSVLVVCNLKEAKLAGFKSNGMVLCASNEDKSDVKFVDPPADSQPGELTLTLTLTLTPTLAPTVTSTSTPTPTPTPTRWPARPRRSGWVVCTWSTPPTW